jgi:hypothetical protein
MCDYVRCNYLGGYVAGRFHECVDFPACSSQYPAAGVWLVEDDVRGMCRPVEKRLA